MHLLLVVRIPFVGFVFVLDKSFVSKAPVLLDICYDAFVVITSFSESVVEYKLSLKRL